MVIATGFFDGVHLGHRLLIDTLVSTARERGDESMIITFFPHPRNVLQKEAADLRFLTTMEEKKRLLTSLGVDHIEVIRFTKEFSKLSAKEYLQQYVTERFGGSSVVFGYDNRIGNEAIQQSLPAVAKSLGLDVVIAPSAPSADGFPISSTRIRNFLYCGEVAAAKDLLGYNYSLQGVVVSGDRIGRTLGFPTANMQLYDPLKLVPAKGSYLVSVRTVGGEFFGMCNIGSRPTVRDGNACTIETHIFDFNEDIYGLDMEISFLGRIRAELKFGSLEDLRLQLVRDREYCLALLSSF